MATLLEQLGRTSAKLALPAEAPPAADPESVYERASKSTLVIGGLYKCDKCSHTHANCASGFVLTAAGVAVTNYHVVDVKQNMTVVAATQDGRVLAVREALPADRARDVAVMQLDIPLKGKAALDTNRYESGIKVSDKALDAVRIKRDDFHGEWTYSIRPNEKIG